MEAVGCYSGKAHDYLFVCLFVLWHFVLVDDASTYYPLRVNKNKMK